MPRRCNVDGCERDSVTRGWCHGHYQRWWRLGTLRPDLPLLRRRNVECSVAGCDRDAYARQLCKVHYRRQLATGDPQSQKPVRVIAGRGYVNHGYRYVPVPRAVRHLTNGETPYPEHRLVMAQMLGRPLLPEESVHHRNGNRVDNRSSNLELWSRWQPRGQRVVDKIDFAVEILRRYAPHCLAPDVSGPRGPSERLTPPR